MKDTIDMAREAWEQSGEGWVHPDWFEDRAKALKAFEALVRADEREACAKVCEDAAEDGSEMDGYDTAYNCAATIRARGNT